MPHSKDRSDLEVYVHTRINKNETDLKRNILQDGIGFPVPAFRSQQRFISTLLMLREMCPQTLTKQPDFLSTIHCLVNVAVTIWLVIGGTDGEQIYGSTYALLGEDGGERSTPRPGRCYSGRETLCPFYN